jgi:hypothetical protein
MKSALKLSIYGHLIDRYLFNFRVDSKTLQSHLPSVKWLRPRVVNGYGVVSFCLLRLQGVTLWPLPSQLGLDTVSCAYRCAIIDDSGERPQSSVYVLGRNTDLPVASRFGSLLFSGTMKMIRSSIDVLQSHVNIRTSFLDGQQLFSAKAKLQKSGGKTDSKLFGSLGAFVDFIKGGESSYTPSTREGKYSRVDLTEDSSHYEAIDAIIDYSWLDRAWPDVKLVFDSAFHAGGGRYKLKYVGSVLTHQQTGLDTNIKT